MNDSAKVRGILVSHGNFSASADLLKGKEKGIFQSRIEK